MTTAQDLADELDRAIASAGGATLPITAGLAQVASLLGLVTTYFPAGTVVVIDPTVRVDGPAVVVGGLVPFGTLERCPVEFQLTPVGEDVAAVIRLTPPAPWKLAAVFPGASVPPASDLQFSGGGLVARTRLMPPGSTWTPGLAVDALLDSGRTGGIVSVLFGDAQLAASAVVFDPAVPVFDLATAPHDVVIAGVDLGAASVVLSLENVALPGKPALSFGSLALVAEMSAAGVSGTVTAALPVDTSVLRLNAEFEDATLAQLADLPAYADGASLTSTLPPALASAFRGATSAIRLKSLALAIDLSELDIASVEVVVAVDLADFRPFGPLEPVVIEEIDFSWSMDRTSTPATSTFSAVASLELAAGCPATVTFAAGIGDDYSVAINQQPGTPLPLNAIATTYLQGVAMPEVSLEDFALLLRPARSRYSVSASFVESWSVPGKPALVLDEVALDLLYDGSYLSGSVVGVLSLDLPMGDPTPPIEPPAPTSVAFTLSAARPPGVDGWILDGHSGAGQTISVTALAGALAEPFGVAVNPPAALASLEVRDIGVHLDTAADTFVFGCEIDFTIDGHPVDLVISLVIDGDQTTFTGTLLAGPVLFDVVADRGASTVLIATCRAAPDQPAVVNLHDLVADLSPTAATAIPDDLHIQVDDLKLVLVRQDDSPTEAALALDLSLAFGLDRVPVIGRLLPQDTVRVDHLQLLASSGAMPADQAAIVNALLPAGVVPFPAGGLASGAAASAVIAVGDDSRPVSLGLPVAATSARPPSPVLRGEVLPATEPPSASSSAGTTRWFAIQRTAGPFTLARVGLAYQDNALFFLLDASASLGGLELGFSGLGIGSPLSEWSPKGHLDGVSVAFQQGELTLEGGLLHNPAPPDGVTDEYVGTVTVGIGAVQVSGVAAFARVVDETTKSDHSSFFAFAQIDADIGGPPAFVITGLMGGFGHDWSLRLPAADAVSTFPLVAGLTDPSVFGSIKPTPDQVLAKLTAGDAPWVSPTTGERWIAAGLRFSSFELIAGQLLAVVAFGADEEIALLGLASITLPQSASSKQAYAFVELQLEVVLQPRDGVFSAIASLTPNSFLLTKDCHLTGGFALCFWFEGSPHAGDFVLAIGGYHPAFEVPAWYPAVAPVGINWKIGSTVLMKGSAYFALTPTAVMAGGSLELVFQAGGLKAWLTAVTNLLIRWRPFAFDAEIGVGVGVSYRLKLGFTTVTLAAELSANLQLWGPPTGGVVHVHWWVISFSIPFGSPAGHEVDPTLDWQGFQALLPSGAAALPSPAAVVAAGVGEARADTVGPLVLGLTIERGLTSVGEDGAWNVRADRLRVRATSAAPITSVVFGGRPSHTATDAAAPASFGIRPMALADVTSELVLGVPAAWPDPEVVTSVLPAAMWGAPLLPGTAPPATAEVVEGLITGLVFAPPPATEGPATELIDVRNLVDAVFATDEPLAPASQPDPIPPPAVEPGSIGLIERGVASATNLAVQDAIVAALTAVGAAPPTHAPLTAVGAQAGTLFDAPPLCATTTDGSTF